MKFPPDTVHQKLLKSIQLIMIIIQNLYSAIMLLAVENIKRGTIFETHCIHVQQRQQLLHIVASPLNNLLNIVGCLCAHSACVCGNCSGRAIHNDVDVQNGESSSRETVLATFRRDSQFLPVSR